MSVTFIFKYFPTNTTFFSFSFVCLNNNFFPIVFFYFKKLCKILTLKKPRNMVIFKLYLKNDQKLR